MATGRESPKIDSDKALVGILALLAAEREERLADDKSARKTELILTNAGLSLGEVAQVTGKNYGAVKQAVRRGRKK